MIGHNIAYLRNRKGLSQRELAAKLNISSGAMGMYETGKREPDIATMQRIADFFDVDVGFLLTGKLASDKDPLLERIRTLSPESRAELEKFALLLELKERHDAETGNSDNFGA